MGIEGLSALLSKRGLKPTRKLLSSFSGGIVAIDGRMISLIALDAILPRSDEQADA